MTRTVLLRLSNTGEPVNKEAVTNGVLILPSQALPDDHKGALFTLQFQLNAALDVCERAVLKTNVPKSESDAFDREKYQELAIEASFHKDPVLLVPIFAPGAYNYYIAYGDNKRTKKFYFNVPPYLSKNGHFVPFNAVNIQTVVSKWIGDLLRWDSFFGGVAAKGYNMIHFTPLQQRGSSNSPYLIYDQLRFDPDIFPDNDTAAEKISSTLRKHGLLSLTDIVWNHTADNSEWLREHPESGYNAETAPHLTAAIELDAKLLEFSEKLEEYGLPTDIKSEADISNIIDNGIVPHVINTLELWQYYVYDRAQLLADLDGAKSADVDVPVELRGAGLHEVATFVEKAASPGSKLGARFGNVLDASKVRGIVDKVYGGDVVKHAGAIVDEINAPLYAMYDDDVLSIKTQLAGRIRFLRLEDGGPKLGRVTPDAPLTEPYFTRFKSHGREYQLANNGWIWGGNPLIDFASDQLRAYLRREVIVWGDCVKLRYGSGPEDSPYLWKRMTEYTQMCARHFNGFRIDNCHLTPLHVGERLLDAARRENRDLYVVAELFSGSAEMDKIYVEHLGINSLIREAMQLHTVAELSTLVHKHGGRPIGSFTWLPLDLFALHPKPEDAERNSLDCGLTQAGLPKVLTSQVPHALVMDCTHDNETPTQKRTTEDTLPNAALVAFCLSAIGSVYGYDELYPHLLDVVGESRTYAEERDSKDTVGYVKSRLYAIRRQLAEESKDVLNDHETYIHHQGQYITVQRHNARTGRGWFLIARTKFTGGEPSETLEPCRFGGTKVKHEFSYRLEVTGEAQRDEKKITGVPGQVVELEAPRSEYGDGELVVYVDAAKFPCGSISVFLTEIPGCGSALEEFLTAEAHTATSKLDLYDLNAVMYRCEAEERDASNGSDGVYAIPDHGTLVYAGLEGWNTAMRYAVWLNDLGGAFANHLRSGSWALDYVVARLDKYSSEGVDQFQKWLRERMERIKEVLPYFLRPYLFALVMGIAYESTRMRALTLLSDEIHASTNFVQRLALTSVQMLGRMQSTSLRAFEQVPSIAAGLPHFSSDYMRCWGRDVFISFRGLMLVTGRYDDARRHILGFAQTLKHGLIPNLLDAGRNPRYNARDAAWFFIQAIQDYVAEVPNGHEILEERVTRRFPLDDTYVKYDSPEAFNYESLIKEIIYEILSRHAAGIQYREANAGPNLDSQMSDEGFNVQVHIDWATGLVHGGSQHNCGTWMDKMGESVRAGLRGVPGTPRDGAAVELQGLLKSALRWVVQLHKEGRFDWDRVTREDGSEITFADWDALVQANFEKHFYVPQDAGDDGKYIVDLGLVNRRGIYKDLYGLGKEYEDYQLRPNFAIAMCVAPELFKVEHAVSAIDVADRVIRGPVGMRTLDPLDYNYRPYYNNGVDNDDFATSKGRNYHQGPEWVWCTGYFLRAYHKFKGGKVRDGTVEDTSMRVLRELNERLLGHIRWIVESPWAGLTELTQKDGELCGDLSPTQAWSSSCLLDLYYDVWSPEKQRLVKA